MRRNSSNNRNNELQTRIEHNIAKHVYEQKIKANKMWVSKRCLKVIYS